MAKWEISKSFDFCYGHRVHTQVLDTELSCNAKCKCRHQHGHQGLLTVYLPDDELNEQGMVLDFVNLNFVKKFIDDVVDHKMILDMEDPSLKVLYPVLSKIDTYNGESIDEYLEYHTDGKYFSIWKDLYADEPSFQKEIYEGLVFVPFIPTSENLAKWFYDVISDKLKGIARVSHIEFYETPKSKSVYYG